MQYPGAAVVGLLYVDAGGGFVVRRSSAPNGGNGTGQTIVASSITIVSGGAMSADGEGFSGSPGGPGAPGTYWGASHGGSGGLGNNGTYGSLTNPVELGSVGDCCGANGGGAITIVSSGTVTVNGRLTADGLGVFGGGSGGSLNITAVVLSGTGLISANGGTNTNVYPSGGGGRIGLNGVTTDNFSGSVEVKGGPNGDSAYPGYAGTIYFNAARRNQLVLGGGGNLSSLRLGSDDSNDYTFSEIVVQSGGLLEIDGNPTRTGANGSAATINVGSMTVQSGGFVSAIGLGFKLQGGPGNWVGGSGNYSIGGTHGGIGGYNVSNTYGSVTNPTSLGSGGSLSSPHGGGAIIINSSGPVVVNGYITANSSNTAYSVGAGGSVNIIAKSLTGGGTIQASAGVGSGQGGGGGGRIAVKLSTGTNFGTVAFYANGGSGNAINGSAGTIYLEDANDGTNNGELFIDNNNVSSNLTTTISTAVTNVVVGTVTIRNSGKLALASNTTIYVSRDWVTTNGNQYISSGTVLFMSNSSAQFVRNNGQAFGLVRSSNTSSLGVTFTSSFTAAGLTVDAATLGAPATVYFAGNSTFTIKRIFTI
jgi:hypothetical protein